MSKKLDWRKGGRIFDPTSRFDWMNCYSQNPNVLVLPDRLRIYFTTRPKREFSGEMVSYTGFAEFEKEEPFNLISVHDEPVLELGSKGEFDEFGIMPGSIVHLPEVNEVRLYYVGWSRMQSVPYKWSNSVAISKDGGITFNKLFSGPLLGTDRYDPYLQACPRVKRFGKDEWFMWYESGLGWNDVDGHMESVYQTKMARSNDGINWVKDPDLVFEAIVPNECQTSPSYFYHDGLHHMIFSFRHGIDFRNNRNGYRIGYAYSEDKLHWTRNDSLAGITLSDQGWDSEMICYPDVFELNGNLYMLYCGNYFGESGFGYANLVG